MTAGSFELTAFWGPREETAEACAARLAQMLSGLAAVHPVFASWNKQAHSRAAANKPFCAMPPRIEELTRIFEKGRSRKDVPPVVWPELGFWVSAWNGRDDAGASFIVHPGSFSDSPPFPNHVEMQMPGSRSGQEELLRAGLVKQVLLAVVAAWAPDWAVIDKMGWHDRFLDKAGQLPRPWAGWMTYLSAPFADRVTPPAEALHERTADGGLLILATEAPLDIDDPAHGAALDAVQAALKPIQD